MGGATRYVTQYPSKDRARATNRAKATGQPDGRHGHLQILSILRHAVP